MNILCNLIEVLKWERQRAVPQEESNDETYPQILLHNITKSKII